MKLTKIIIFNIIAFITAINIFYVYYGAGSPQMSFTKEFFANNALPLLLITTIFITNLFANISHLATRAIIKKNFLKINFILLLIILGFSIFSRIKELISGVFCIQCWTLTLLYLILFILTILMLRSLFKLIRELFLPED